MIDIGNSGVEGLGKNNSCERSVILMDLILGTLFNIFQFIGKWGKG